MQIISTLFNAFKYCKSNKGLQQYYYINTKQKLQQISNYCNFRKKILLLAQKQYFTSSLTSSYIKNQQQLKPKNYFQQSNEANGKSKIKNDSSSESNFWHKKAPQYIKEVKEFCKKYPNDQSLGDIDYSVRVDHKNNTFDLIVIGGGSGGIYNKQIFIALIEGLAAARRASSYGANVAIIEKGNLGGTCVNLGCIPKKIMYNFAETNEIINQHSVHYAQTLERPSIFSWQKMKESRDSYVRKLNEIYQSSLLKENITIIKGEAKFLSRSVIQVNGDKHYRAEKILIATGGRPILPNIQGANLGYTSDDFFNKINKLPKSVGIAGAGYIAIELAGILKSLGTEVTLFIRYGDFLRKFDPMIYQSLRTEFEKQNIITVPYSQAQSLILDERDKTITYISQENQNFEGFDHFIWAIGRQPNIEDLDVSKAFVECDQNKYIKTNEWSETSSPNVYALGDVCGKVELTPTAIKEARIFADRIYGRMKDIKPVNLSLIPTVIFSHPPIGTVGLTQPQAIEKYGKNRIAVYYQQFTNLYYSIFDLKNDEKPKTHIKVIVDTQQNNKVLGMHIIGKSADEIIQGFSVAIQMGCTLQDLQNTLAIHPTAAEEFVLLQEANKIDVSLEIQSENKKEKEVGC